MGAVTTEQQKLVLNSFAMVLQNNLVSRDAVSWNEYDGEMDDRNGMQVLEQITPRYNVTRTENGVKDLSAGTDGTVFGSELFEITGTFNANSGMGRFRQGQVDWRCSREQGFARRRNVHGRENRRLHSRKGRQCVGRLGR